MTGPGNGIAWQLADHEKRLSALEGAKVDVLAERQQQIRTDIGGLRVDLAAAREEIAGIKQLFVRGALGLFTTILGGVIIAYLVSAVH